MLIQYLLAYKTFIYLTTQIIFDINCEKRQMTAAVSEQYRCLVDILTCLVCKQMVTKAHICPNCSKFYCLECIMSQLAIEQTCLNCNKFLQVSMLVNCQKLCCQLTETLEKVSIKRQDQVKPYHQKQSLYCGKHKLQKTYYCKTCEKPLCSDCSVLTQNHRGHQFIKLSLIRNMYESKVHQKVDEINAVQKNIEKRLELQDVIKHKKGADNQQALIKFKNAMKLLKQELRKNLKKILNDGEKNLEQITEKIIKWNEIFDKQMKRLKNCSKGHFVEKQYDILEKELLDVLQRIDMQSQNSMNHANLIDKSKQISHSYFNPIYQEFIFLIEGFSMRSNQQGYFYTPNIRTKMGLQWRLKIYPFGINHSNQQSSKNKLIKKSSKNEDEYFAIFIDFVTGCVETTRQKYSLSLINQGNQDRIFTRQFQSEFDIGQCWGYEHFIKLNQMYEDGYYDRDDDELKIVLKICPSNYFQATRDQEALIRQKIKILHEKNIFLNSMEHLRDSDKWLPQTSSQIHLRLLQSSIK